MVSSWIWHAARSLASSAASAARLRPSVGTTSANGGGPAQGPAGVLATISVARDADVVGADASAGRVEAVDTVDAVGTGVVVVTELGGWPARPTPTAVADPASVIATAAAAPTEKRRGRTDDKRARWADATGRATSTSPRRWRRFRKESLSIQGW